MNEEQAKSQRDFSEQVSQFFIGTI